MRIPTSSVTLEGNSQLVGCLGCPSPMSGQSLAGQRRSHDLRLANQQPRARTIEVHKKSSGSSSQLVVFGEIK